MNTTLDIQKILEAIKEGEKNILPNQDQKAVIIIGPSRVGKSTLTSLLCGFPLYVEVCGYGSIRIDGKNLPDGIIIEHTIQAGTAKPKKVTDEINKINYWETAGFGDKKGPTQDIVMAFI